MEATAPRPFTRSQTTQFQQALLAWFRIHARELPWRGTRDLYRIWVSEIMLQQTQVITVRDYYQRFLEQFPTLSSLAAADEQAVLRLWEGLGYYRRARQLHAAAKKIVAEHDGVFPETFPEVLALPGIGRYTAGAILSIGRDAPLPILEANTIRLLSRLIAYRGATTSKEGQALLWQTAAAILPTHEIGQFNQALMELGSLLCTPREPQCGACPAVRLCPTFKLGLQTSIPAPKTPTRYEAAQEVALVLQRRDGQVLLRQHPATERWAGMWDFPRFAKEGSSEEGISQSILTHTGQHVAHWQQLATLKHGVTRFRITLDVLFAKLPSVQNKRLPKTADYCWSTIPQLADIALNTTGRKIAKLLSNLL
jgi:A/G-specific adenine glycosylase